MAAFIKSREFGGKKIIRKKDTPPSPPSYVRLSRNKEEEPQEESQGEGSSQGGTPKGYVPVMVGMEEDKLKRFLVPTRFIKDPSIVALLQLSADEFGYGHQGVLQIPCHPQYFETILARLYKTI